jgi:hypothetical protein
VKTEGCAGLVAFKHATNHFFVLFLFVTLKLSVTMEGTITAGLALLPCNNDGNTVIQDRRYDHDDKKLLELTFADAQAASSCFSDLSRIHQHFDYLTGLVNKENHNEEDRAAVIQSMVDFLKLARPFSETYGFGAITPFLHKPWNDFERHLHEDKTEFDDTIRGGIISRRVDNNK